MNKELRIIFFGTPEFVVPVLQALDEHFEIVGIVTAPDRLVNRKQILTPSPISEYADKHNIPVFKPEKLDQNFICNLLTITCDLVVIASYGKIIPQSVLDIPKFGSLNIHPSLLPKYRGPSPIQAAILNGDKTSGITIIKIDAKMDHGPVVATEDISLSNTDTFDSLSKKMFALGAKLLVKIIPDFMGNKIKPVVQDDSIATYCNMIKKEDGYFDINNPLSPKKLDRMIRAFYPWPTAWTKWNGKIIKFLPNQMVQMEGKKPTKLVDFLRGYSTFPIKNL